MSASTITPQQSGRVVLVGAGPGGPGLLTVAALDALRHADIVLYDRLAGRAFRRFVRPSTELVDVGKRPGASEATQAEICARLVAEARSGRVVVRVKGGDPFIFGRGYEEVVACAEAGVPVEVVPGVSSSLAAPVAAGIPLTHRGMPPVFTVVSGHEDPTKATAGVDWRKLGALDGPLVVLMGVGTIAGTAALLIEGGRSPDTPVAALESMTTPEQRVVRTTLAKAADVFATEGVRSPAVVVVGAQAALADTVPDGLLAAAATAEGLAPRGLAGWRIIVPRSRGGDSMLVHLLRAEGAEVAAVPVLRFVPPRDEDAVRAVVGSLDAGELAAVVFRSAQRVEWFVDALRRHRRDVRALAGVALVAESADAARGLRRFGFEPDEMPGTPAGSVVVPAREGQEEALGPGWVRVDVLRSEVMLPDADSGSALVGADAVVFASSGTAGAWGEGGLATPPVVACVGPRTAEAARDAGMHVDVQPDEHTLPALVASLVTFAAHR